MANLRPHITMPILTAIGLKAWNSKGTKGMDPALAALEWSKSMDKSGLAGCPPSSQLRQAAGAVHCLHTFRQKPSARPEGSFRHELVLAIRQDSDRIVFEPHVVLL